MEVLSSSLAKVGCLRAKLPLLALSPSGFVLALCGEAARLNTALGTGTKGSSMC